MKRRLLIVAVFLLAGAVVNVAVAWGLVGWFCLPDYNWVLDAEESDVDVGADWWRSHAPSGIADDPVEAVEYSPGMGVSVLVMASRSSEEVIRVRAGWPLRSMQGAVWRPYNEEWYECAIDLWFGKGVEVHIALLPLCPMLLGSVVNTLFYAVVLWLLIPGPFVLRRLIRVRRGLCPKCAYPMGKLAVCTECGKTLPSRHIIV